MEAGEGLIEARAHALELVVRVTGDQTCYVALPSRVVGVLNAAAPHLPLPLALTPAGGGGWRRQRSLDGGATNGLVGSSKEPHHPHHHPAAATQAAPAFVAWAGATCVSRSETELEVPMAVADCLGLVDGDACRVAGRANAPFADVVELAPESEQDWLKLLDCAEDVEANLLTQCGCVAEGAPFPFWPGGGGNGRLGSNGDVGGGSKRAPLRLVPTSVSPRGAGAVARLRLDTELRVAPWRPTAAPAAPARPADVQSIPTPGDSMDLMSTDGSAVTPRAAGGSRDAAPPVPVPPAIPVVLRVQSSRGVVVAWPRRLRFSPRGRGGGDSEQSAGSNDSAIRRIGTDHPDEAEVAAWPTAHAFVSEATATARGLAHDAIASVAAVGGGKAVGGPAGGDGEGGPRGRVVVRIVRVPGSVVADGHVVLAPALRDALGATQGTRVTLTLTSIAGPSTGDANGGTAALLRLRPVIREGGDGSEPERGTESKLGDLTAAHLAALGLPRDHVNVDEDAVTDAARDLLASWSATVARFSMTFRNAFRNDGDEKDPNDLNDFGAPPPVATGSVVQLRVGDDSLIATFELEVHAPGGACELTSDVLRRGGSDGAGESSSTPAARVELGGCVRRAAHDPSPVSKLFGTSVTVDATLRDALGTVAPVGSAANEAANDATARLAAALTTVPGGNIPGGVLLWGAPGSGRSGVARCIARTLRDDKRTLASVVYVSCGSMSHSASGDPRAAISAVKAAASAAARRAPAVVILDDLDAIAGGGGGGGAGGGGADAPGGGPGEIVGEVIADVADFLRGRRVALLATATSPESLHDAVRAAGRLDHACELRMPDAADARGAVVKTIADARGTPVSSADVAAAAARKAEGYARGDLTALVERAAHAAAARSMRRPTHAASLAAVEVQHPGSGFDTGVTGVTERDATLGALDFDDARVGLVPAPARALGGSLGVGGDSPGGDSPGEDPLAAVGGLDDVKAALDEALSLPSRHPAVFADAPLRLRTGALLYGPPGCGKTMVIRAAIKAAGVRSVAIKGPELLNKYIGQSEAGVRDAFRRAAAAAPCALFFDEFDSIAPRRGHDSTGVTDRVVNQFLTELDGVEGLRGVVVLAATSRPDLVDPALLRPGRLDRLLRCDFPDVAARLEILENAARDVGLVDDQRALNEDVLGLHAVANDTEGFSGADLRAIVTDARMHAVHRAMDATQLCGAGGAVVVTREDVKRAAREARRSVPPRERERLDAVFAEFRGSRMGSVGERGATPGKSPKRVSLA